MSYRLIIKDRATQDLRRVHPNERKFVVRASCSLVVHVSILWRPTVFAVKMCFHQ